ncbi:hypothetical protein CRYUN_Cryun13aG0136500 [Craigia yunnanensis]
MQTSSLTFKLRLKVVNGARKRPYMLVQVGLEYRYMPPVAKLMEIVKSGTPGQVKMAAMREHRFPFLVKVSNWNRFNVNKGGTLVEKCCHFFDLMKLFAGANPVRVMASGAMDVNHKDEIYDGKFLGEAFVPESIVRFGSRADGRDGVQTLKAEDERIKYEGLHHASNYLEHLNFLPAIREKGAKTPAVDLQDGLISVATGVAAQLSIEKSRFVSIEEVLDEDNCEAFT